LAHETSGGKVASQLFEGLLLPGVGTLKTRPGQAKRFEVSEDGLTYTFHLREGLTWSDGTKMSAEDYVGSWKRALDPKTASQSAYKLLILKGAEDFHAGKTQDFSTVGVKATSPNTLVVRLEHAAPYFPALLSEPTFSPTPLHIIEKHKDRWTRPSNIVSNGAYILDSYRERDRMILVKNPRYWDTKSVSIKKIIMYQTEEETAVMEWYKTGKIQIANPIPNDQIPTLLKEGRSDLKIDPLLCTYYFTLNTTKPPFNNPLVRRALNYAIDKERLVAHLLGAGRIPATHLVHEAFANEGFPIVDGPDFNPDKARSLMKKAGYGPDNPFPKVVLLYNTLESHRAIAQYVQRNLKETLGIEIIPQNLEWKSLLAQTHKQEFTMARTSWCVDYPDPLAFLEVFLPGSDANYGKYSSDAFSKLVKTIRFETDTTRRNKLLRQAEEILNEEAPVIPMYFYTKVYLLHPRVRGFLPHIMERQLFRDMRIAKPGAPQPASPNEGRP